MAANNRQSFLTYDPVKFSLTEGTNIPAPAESPPTTSNGTKPTTNGAAETVQHDAAEQAGPTDSLRSPGPPSVMSKSTSPRRHGVRRLFSLGSLRSSFSSSRASLALPHDSDDHHQLANGVKRPSSPSASFSTAATSQRPVSRPTPRKSNSWFRRKSNMFQPDGENALGTIGEDGRPENKKLREHSPAPLLPEIKSLAGGDLKDGEVEWDDQLFKRPS